MPPAPTKPTYDPIPSNGLFGSLMRGVRSGTTPPSAPDGGGPIPQQVRMIILANSGPPVTYITTSLSQTAQASIGAQGEAHGQGTAINAEMPAGTDPATPSRRASSRLARTATDIAPETPPAPTPVTLIIPSKRALAGNQKLEDEQVALRLAFSELQGDVARLSSTVGEATRRAGDAHNLIGGLNMAIRDLQRMRGSFKVMERDHHRVVAFLEGEDGLARVYSMIDSVTESAEKIDTTLRENVDPLLVGFTASIGELQTRLTDIENTQQEEPGSKRKRLDLPPTTTVMTPSLTAANTSAGHSFAATTHTSTAMSVDPPTLTTATGAAPLPVATPFVNAPAIPDSAGGAGATPIAAHPFQVSLPPAVPMPISSRPIALAPPAVQHTQAPPRRSFQVRFGPINIGGHPPLDALKGLVNQMINGTMISGLVREVHVSPDLAHHYVAILWNQSHALQLVNAWTTSRPDHYREVAAVFLGGKN
ncbi:hypothetical protein BKA70DRAFT_1442798 [Coprinopsis sp. MPI-PUGE-AT-0042]|nr:hypothetical protein BKA70DRAFT_1442798 [Coprinopsis sp. MPI-PUGE-AT-0042]